MKEHLDKQTESLNSLKQELDSLKKGEYEYSEKIRHGQKQLIPITRSKR
jgi:ribosomal protein L7Ae-like RNA K-turn-binding protein